MFEDYYFDNPELQGLLDAIGYYPQATEPMPMAPPIMDAGVPLVAAPAAAPSLIDAAAAAAPAEPTPAPAEPAPTPMTSEEREARRIAANTPPPGTAIVGPYAGKDPLAFGTGNTFNVREGQEVRLVDAAGNVVFSGSGVEGANRAVAVAQSLSDDLGKNANFKIQTGERTINPDGSVGATRYIDVARAAPSQSGLGFLADYVLPFAATFIPGVGPVLGAALGSAASSGLQGRSLEDALKRAALAAGTAGVVSGTGLDTAIGGALSGTGGQAAGQVAGQVAGQAAGSAGDIVVSGVSQALQSAGGALGSAALSQAGNAASRALSGYKTPAEQFAQQPLPEALLPPADIYAGIDPIDVLANRATATATAPNYGGVLSGVFEPIATEFLPKSVLPQPLPSEPTPVDDTIVVTAPQATAAPLPIPGFETAIPATIGGALTAAQTAGTQPSENKFKFNDVLGTGLSVPQLLSLGGVGADLLKNLLAGGGDTGPTTPYVSPFGTGVGFAPGQDMRANPTIMDYERYGFGPEAMFFQPGYGLFSAGAAPQAQPIMAVPQAQPAMVTNPRYEPLI